MDMCTSTNSVVTLLDEMEHYIDLVLAGEMWQTVPTSHSFASLESDHHQPDTDCVADINASGTCLLDNVYWHLYWSFDLLQEAQAVQSSSVKNDNKTKNLEDKFTKLQNPRSDLNAWIIQSSLHTKLSGGHVCHQNLQNFKYQIVTKMALTKHRNTRFPTCKFYRVREMMVIWQDIKTCV